MGSPKSIAGLVAAFVPVLFFTGLTLYFIAVPGRLATTVGLPEEATSGMTAQLGPTVIGVGGIAVLCAFAFVLKLIRAASRGTPAPGAVTLDEEEPFDADAALARYMARKAAGGEPAAVAAEEVPVVTPLGFGRKSA